MRVFGRWESERMWVVEVREGEIKERQDRVRVIAGRVGRQKE